MPYGETRVESGQRLDLGYTGHKWDAETKQYFAPYRYYSPANSRWISRDPLGFVDGPNVYGYVGGMPTRFYDLLGLYSMKDCMDWYHDKKRTQRELAMVDIADATITGTLSAATITSIIVYAAPLGIGAALSAGIQPGFLLRNIPTITLLLEMTEISLDFYAAGKPARDIIREEDALQEFLNRCIRGAK